jgi:hypothetical protein
LQLSGDGSGGGGDDGAACEPDSGGAHPAGSVWQTVGIDSCHERRIDH